MFYDSTCTSFQRSKGVRSLTRSHSYRFVSIARNDIYCEIIDLGEPILNRSINYTKNKPKMSRKRSREEDLLCTELCRVEKRIKTLSDAQSETIANEYRKRKSNLAPVVNSKRRKLNQVAIPLPDVNAMRTCVGKLVTMYTAKKNDLVAEQNKTAALNLDNFQLQKRVYELEQQLSFAGGRGIQPTILMSEPWHSENTDMHIGYPTARG